MSEAVMTLVIVVAVWAAVLFFGLWRIDHYFLNDAWGRAAQAYSELEEKTTELRAAEARVLNREVDLKQAVETGEKFARIATVLSDRLERINRVLQDKEAE